ncbi:MAG TPA: 3-hydroxybutyryl-CoA dehydrogenase, partial [Actinomycetota bacterium]
GSGIVEVCAKADCEVVTVEVDDQAMDRGRQRFEKSLGTAVDRGKLEEGARDQILGRITSTTDLDAAADADLVIEAVTENLDEKLRVFRRLDEITRDEVILATNTSSLPIVKLAAATKRPDRVVGMHFFNPPPIMTLLEIVRALTTSDETLGFAKGMGERLGKTTVLSKDRAGFIVNMLLIPYLNNAVRMLEEGFASREDIDTAIQLGLGHPMGPLTLLDFIGLDTAVYVSEVLFEEFRDPDYSAPPLLRRMVDAGWHGRKTGKGFYDYD